MFRWSIEAESYAKATAQAVWKAWADVPSWPEWDKSLAWCKLEETFAPVAKGKHKPKRGISSSFTIVSAEKERRFTTTARLLRSEIVFSHYVAPWWDDKVRIVHRVEVSGFFAPLLWLFFGRKRKRELPKTLQKLALRLEA